MDNLVRLRNTLRRALEQEEGVGTQELFEALQVSLPTLKRVGKPQEKSPQERRELEAGRTTLRGKELAINADFAKHAVFLADQLLVSERACTSLLHDINLLHPNAPAVQCVEAAVVEFQRRKQACADSLFILLQAAHASENSNPVQLFKWIDQFVRRELLAERPGQESLASAVFAELASTSQTIGRVQGARTAASSETSLPATFGANGSLGHDVLDARCKFLMRERQTLATIMHSIAHLGWLNGAEVKKLVDWLHDNPQNPSTYQILAAALTALQPVPSPQQQSSLSSSSSSSDRIAILGDRTLATHMRTTLIPTASWTEPGLKAALTLQWALFATDARRRDASLEHVQGYTTEEVETAIWNGCQGGAFPYLARLVRRTRRQGPGALDDTPPGEQDISCPEPPEQEFVPAFLDTLEVLVRTLIRHASSELRKIKQRQEDVVLANARLDRSRLGRSAASAPAPDAPRNDIAALFAFIGTLYTSIGPERALQFWGANPLASTANPTKSALAAAVAMEIQTPRLPGFLQWSAWSTQSTNHETLTALYAMLAGLSHGEHCSELAYNFVAQGAGENLAGVPVVSWAAVFGVLDSWASALSAPKPQPQSQSASQFGMTSLSRPTPAPAPLILGPRDVLLAQAFLRFLASTVTHSIEVRKAVAGHGHFRAIPTLVTLIPLGAPLELKGALFATLAAFCEPGAGPAGVDICKAVWGLMERMEVISLRPGSGGVGMAAGVRGVEVELEEVEAVHKLYPSTLPFLHLLATLIHTPKRLRLRDRLLDVESLNTIPDALGAPYRLPGIGPFIAFVIDEVFSQISQRDYHRPSDRWRMNDLCLCFIERCLAAYDLTPLATLGDNVRISPEMIVPYVVHPGHEVLKRILTNTPLQSLILSYIADGVDGFDRGFAAEEPFFQSTMVRVLRIVNRVLELQGLFLDVLTPLVSDFDHTGAALPRSSYTSLDQALSFGAQYAPALAAYVNYPTYPELVLLSVKILAQLARSTAFTNFATVLERSADSDRVMQSYMRILSVDSLQEVSDAEASADDFTGAGAPDSDPLPDLAQATRLAVIELLAEHTAPARSWPNVAHFLLFGDSQAQAIENPQALNAEPACIHVVLQTLNDGVPHGNKRAADEDLNEPLFVVLPTLAERLVQVLHNLCNHPRTSEFTLRYLRSREDFFWRQITTLPFHAPSSAAVEDRTTIQVVYGDGARAVTTVPGLSAFLRYRAQVMSLSALDVHVQTSKGHSRGVAELVQLLFSLEDRVTGDDAVLEDRLQLFRDIGQSNLRIIELANSLDFEWSDSLAVENVDLRFLSGLNLQACVRRNASGCEVVDQNILVALLTEGRRILQTQGKIATQADVDQLAAEVTYILESCAVENHRREVAHAVAGGFEAWRNLLTVALIKSFDNLAPGSQEGMLFDVLHVLPRLIRSDNVQDGTKVILAEAVVAVMTKLRESRKADSPTGAAGALPTERLHSLLRSIVGCLLDTRQSELVRGNMYVALNDYLQLIKSTASPVKFPVDTLSASHSPALDTSLALGSGIPNSLLRKGTLAILKEVSGRLISIVARDALDGAEVWKTVAFTALDGLIELAEFDSSNSAIAELAKTGMPANFIQSVRKSDQRIQSVLQPEPDDLNVLYVYEAQMSMLIRIAQTRQGAERLHELQLLSILAQAEFIDARPDDSAVYADAGYFVPPSMARYHQLIMPVLQLLSAMFGSLGSSHATAGALVLEFFVSHRDVIALMLGSDQNPTSLSALREAHMVVQACNMILPLVPKRELISSITGYGAIHAAILSMAAHVFRSGLSTSGFQPLTEAELLDAQTPDEGPASTRFEADVLAAKAALHQVLATYLGVASDFAEPEISLVLSPDPAPRIERASRYAGIPSVIDVVCALEAVGRRLHGTLIHLVELSAELHELSTSTSLVLSQSALMSSQLQRLPSARETESSRLRSNALREAKSMTNTVETLLLLLWRHIIAYMDREEGLTLSVPTSFAQSARGYVNYDKGSLRTEVNRQFHSSLQLLTTFPWDPTDPTWRGHATYINILTKRLQEATGGPQDNQ